MTRSTKSKPPARPDGGGSFRRQKNGNLVRVEGTEPSDGPEAAPAAAPDGVEGAAGNPGSVSGAGDTVAGAGAGGEQEG